MIMIVLIIIWKLYKNYSSNMEARIVCKINFWITMLFIIIFTLFIHQPLTKREFFTQAKHVLEFPLLGIFLMTCHNLDLALLQLDRLLAVRWPLLYTAWVTPTTGLLASAASKLTALLVCAAINYADPLPNRDIFLDYMLRAQVFMYRDFQKTIPSLKSGAVSTQTTNNLTMLLHLNFPDCFYMLIVSLVH